MTQPIHAEISFNGAAQRVYRALTEAAEFSAFTGGAPAQIEARPGGAFSCFGGMIEGRNVELVPGRRVVQAWRAKNWPEGVYSIARFELGEAGGRTTLTFDQAGFPADQRPHLEGGWAKMYWEPLQRHLA